MVKEKDIVIMNLPGGSGLENMGRCDRGRGKGKGEEVGENIDICSQGCMMIVV